MARSQWLVFPIESRGSRLGYTIGAYTLVACVMAAPAAAQEGQPTGNADGEAARPGEGSEREAQPQGFWRQAASGVKRIWTSGGPDLYVPGYIWHMPYRYSEEQISRYNTAAWGVGYGRTLSGANRSRSLYAIVSADSYAKPQYILGYAWRARWHPGGGPFSVGGGYTAMVLGRQDKASYAPLPLVLPLGTVAVDRLELMGVYIPYFEVSYFSLRVNFGEQPSASPQK
jgi:palmitoyl transferase